MYVTFVNRTGETVLIETQLVDDGGFSSFLLFPEDSNRVGDRGQRMYWRWVRGKISPNDRNWKCIANPETTVIVDGSVESSRCEWSPAS